MIKCHRTIDPKLRIRPFRSKVTFSEDTKAGSDTSEMMVNNAGQNGQNTRTNVFTKWDSSSDSVASMLKIQDEVISLKRHKFTLSKPVQASNQQGSSLKISEIPFSDMSKRRQSLDPTLYNKSIKPVEPVTQDNWLHYQSLPNIQEEEMSNPASPTEMTLIGDQSNSQRPPSGQGNKVNITKNNINSTNNQAKLLSPEVSMEGANPQASTRRRSIKRQKSQEIADEDLVARQALVPPVQPALQQAKKMSIMKKQASNESESSNLTDNSTTSASNQQNLTNKPHSTMAPPQGILRKRKDDLKSRQASTESDTGSYHTVRSFRTQLETSNSSSVDSFTSAVSESNNTTSQSSGVVATPVVTSSPTPATMSIEHLPSRQQYQPPVYAPMQSTLVPKIVFSQSTPSVTSQSSDDQNSPRWDEHKDFSSIDTVIEYSYRIPRQNAPLTSSGAISLANQPITTPPVTTRASPLPETLRFESSKGVVCVRVHPQQSQDSVIDIDEDSNISGSNISQQQHPQP